MPVPNHHIQDDDENDDDDDEEDEIDLSDSHCTGLSEHTEKLNNGLKPAAKNDASRAAFGRTAIRRIFID